MCGILCIATNFSGQGADSAKVSVFKVVMISIVLICTLAHSLQYRLCRDSSVNGHCHLQDVAVQKLVVSNFIDLLAARGPDSLRSIQARHTVAQEVTI